MYHPGSQRVQNDLPGQLKQVAFLFDQDRFVPSLKDMAYPAVPSIVLLGIDTVQLAHAMGEITFWRFNQKVVMAAHQAIGMTQPVITSPSKPRNAARSSSSS